MFGRIFFEEKNLFYFEILILQNRSNPVCKMIEIIFPNKQHITYNFPHECMNMYFKIHTIISRMRVSAGNKGNEGEKVVED